MLSALSYLQSRHSRIGGFTGSRGGGYLAVYDHPCEMARRLSRLTTHWGKQRSLLPIPLAGGISRLTSVQGVGEPLFLADYLHLSKGTGLELTNPFSANAESPPDFFQGVFLATAEAKS